MAPRSVLHAPLQPVPPLKPAVPAAGALSYLQPSARLRLHQHQPPPHKHRPVNSHKSHTVHPLYIPASRPHITVLPLSLHPLPTHSTLLPHQSSLQPIRRQPHLRLLSYSLPTPQARSSRAGSNTSAPRTCGIQMLANYGLRYYATLMADTPWKREGGWLVVVRHW